MAIQTHINPDNLFLQNSSQDYFVTSSNYNYNYNNNINNNNYNLLQQQQQQLHNMVNFHNMQKRNSCVNDNGFEFLQPSKKQRIENTTGITRATTVATTATTTTSESDISQTFCVEFEKQRLEIDRFINLQNERLRMALHEQRKQQLRAIIMKLEAKSMQLLKQKDDEIAMVKYKYMELQEIMRKLVIENQTWQRITSEKEAIVVSLNNTISQLQQQQQVCSSTSSNDIEDAESCCDLIDNKKEKMRNDELCKVCNAAKVCVLMLPCRHLCCCKVCDGFVDACPVCKSSKIGSIEALI